MDLLVAFRTFIRIAETGSFSAVAREVGATQPAISRQIAALEEHLGARLLQRSTRSLRLTEDGTDLLGHARRVVEAVEETEAVIGKRRGSPTGMVRLGFPGVFGHRYITPRIGLLLARYPGLSVDLVAADDVVDMVQDGLDLAIRIAPMTDPTLVARRVGSTTMITVASPAYLAERGTPQQPQDLSEHDCVIFTRLQTPDLWTLTRGETAEQVAVAGRLHTNSIEGVLQAALAGAGIALLPSWLVRDELSQGALQTVLEAWQPGRRAISVVYPSRRFLAPRTRAVIDFLVDEFRLDPAISAYGEG